MGRGLKIGAHIPNGWPFGLADRNSMGQALIEERQILLPLLGALLLQPEHQLHFRILIRLCMSILGQISTDPKLLVCSAAAKPVGA